MGIEWMEKGGKDGCHGVVMWRVILARIERWKVMRECCCSRSGCIVYVYLVDTHLNVA